VCIGGSLESDRHQVKTIWLPPQLPRSRAIASIASEHAREHSVRDRGVGGSNPLAPTNKHRRIWKGPGNRALRAYGRPCHDVPGGVTRCGQASGQLPTWLPCFTSHQVVASGNSRRRSGTHLSTETAWLDETRVDEHYAMVRAQFVWHFEKGATAPIDVEVDSMFILYLNDGMPTMVLHLEHEDFWQLLRARGVLAVQG